MQAQIALKIALHSVLEFALEISLSDIFEKNKGTSVCHTFSTSSNCQNKLASTCLTITRKFETFYIVILHIN
jgi:hypothetical protein